MGISWSNSNRRRNSYPPPFPQHLPPTYYYSAETHPHPHPRPPPPPPPPPQGYFFTSANPSTGGYVPLPPPPHPPQTHSFYCANGYTATSSANTTTPNYADSMVGRHPYHTFYPNQVVWTSVRPLAGPAAAPPPPYVDHQTTKKIRNDVNLHKDTLRLEVDEHNPDHHLVSFVFDALYDGSITIYYLAKEEEKCRFIPLFPDAFEPITLPFQKGAGQKFCQPSGTGIDLGFFELDDLAKPSPGEDVFPLVICAETSVRTSSVDETPGDSMIGESPRMQVTQAVLEKSNGSGPFQVKVVRQILWIDGVCYELRELYGIGSSTAADFDDNDPGKECVICMTEPKDTAVLPCRHMCMCSECAKALRLQSNKCPICRQPIKELIEIKINSGDQ